MTITAEQVEAALEWLVTNATRAAQARANRVYLQDFVKVVRAERQVKEMLGGASAAAAEALALASEEYKVALLGLKAAVEEDERMRWLCTTAESRIEAWRSLEATRRAQERIG